MNLAKSPPRKLGANRKEPARQRRQPRRPSESRDVREDRGARQSKFAHVLRTTR